MSDAAMMQLLRSVVVEQARTAPRGLQRHIGPSEIGVPCLRRLGYRLLEVPAVNTEQDPWASVVGTAVHAWLAQAFLEQNIRLGRDRWMVETGVDLVGSTSGTVDLYDSDTGTVIDHKVVGQAAMTRYSKLGPSQQYRTQVHVYATGMRLAGHRVERVGIMYWSRSGGLRDGFYWSEPYEEDITEQALGRLHGLIDLVSVGPSVLGMLPTADAFCAYCPNYLPAVTSVEEACPGHRDASSTTQ